MQLQTQKRLFRLSSQLTDHMPLVGATLLNTVFNAVLTSSGAEKKFAETTRRALDRMEPPRRIAVLSDIHLGDALMLQSAVMALRDFFPCAAIDYVVSRSAACMLEGNPEISSLVPLYTGAPMPSAQDMADVASLCEAGSYDLIVNACPSFVPGSPIPLRLPTLDLLCQTPRLLRNDHRPTEPNHLLYQSNVFLHQALGSRFPAVRQRPPRGVPLALPVEAFEAAGEFLAGQMWQAGVPVALVNPDTGSRFTQPPLEFLVELVERLTLESCRVLVAEGRTDPGVGCRLIEALSNGAALRARLVPASMDMQTFAALTDLVDVFVSGDTGPLHWAAARKRSIPDGPPRRNRTQVISLFGATPARMSGYDSTLPGFLPAWQDAPSSTFVSAAPCRNITCLNKLHKTCRVARCFEHIGLEPVVGAILAHLGRGPRFAPAVAKVGAQTVVWGEAVSGGYPATDSR